MSRLVVFVLALVFARESVALEVEEPPKPKTATKKKALPVETPPLANDLDLDLDLDLDMSAKPPSEVPGPAKGVDLSVLGGDFDLDLPSPVVNMPTAPLVPPVVAEQPLPPPPIVEPPVLPVMIVKRVAVPDLPSSKSVWALAVGVTLGGSARSLTDTNGLGLIDGGSVLIGLTARMQYTVWALQFDWRYVREDRQLVATVRSDSGQQYAARASYLGWDPFEEIRVNLGLAARRRSHTGSPQAAWWATHGIDPVDTDLALVPAIEWPFTDYLVLTAALYLGYGWSSVNAHAFRDSSGPFADVEVGLLIPKAF